MKLTKCEKGHFYDGDKYSSCPHCHQSAPDFETISIQAASVGGDDETISINEVKRPSIKEISASDDEKTIGFFGNFDGEKEDGKVDPCVGWLVCVEGKQVGQDFKLKSGNNSIGRDKSMDICLKGDEVSRIKHSIITYDPKNNIFLALPGESHGLSYVNDNIVVSATVLKRGDRIEIGGNILLFIPLCDEDFQWKKN